MTRPALRLLTALAMLLLAMIGLPPARALADPGPVAMCHAGDDGTAPVPVGLPAHHDCLACPICAAATMPALLVPSPPELPRSGRTDAADQSWTFPAAPSPDRPPANLPRGPPRVA